MTLLRSRSLLKGYFPRTNEDEVKHNNSTRSISPTPSTKEKLAPATPPLTLTPDEEDDSTNHGVFMREAYTLPNVQDWPHRPLMLCLNSAASPSLCVPEHGHAPCPIGVPFRCQSDLFEGTVLIRLKDANSDSPVGDDKYFSGRKRLFQHVIQGRFKKEISASEVVAGYEFAKPLKNLPHRMLVKSTVALAQKIVPGIDIQVHSDHPHAMATLLGASKVVRADEPGSEPDITCSDFEEDCSLFGGDFAKGNVSAFRRRRNFTNPSKCQDYYYDTDKIYTFDMYDYVLHFPSMSLPLGFTSIDLQPVLAEQPVTWSGKMRDGRHLWSFQIWHESLLPTSEVSDKNRNILLEE